MGFKGQRSDMRRTWEREVKLHGGGKMSTLTLEEMPSTGVRYGLCEFGRVTDNSQKKDVINILSRDLSFWIIKSLQNVAMV